jgi:hypothetical protein
MHHFYISEACDKDEQFIGAAHHHLCSTNTLGDTQVQRT